VGVNRVRGKKLVWISIAALLVTAMVSIGNANGGIKLFAGLGGAAPGETFDVYPRVSGLPTFPFPQYLFLAEIFMDFDPDLLEVVGIDIGDDPATMEVEGFDFIYIGLWDNEGGSLQILAGRPPGVFEGLGGDIKCAKITFLMKAEGTCDLDIYDTRLIELSGRDLDHTAIDGYAETYWMPPRLYVQKRGAEIHPEWHSREYYECLTNTIHVLVMNYDPVAYNIKVTVKIDTPMHGTYTMSVIVTIPAASIEPGSVIVSVDFHVPGPGTYEVSAGLKYEVVPGVWSDNVAEPVTRSPANQAKFKAR
jgi:hypothetical protein